MVFYFPKCQGLHYHLWLFEPLYDGMIWLSFIFNTLVQLNEATDLRSLNSRLMESKGFSILHQLGVKCLHVFHRRHHDFHGWAAIPMRAWEERTFSASNSSASKILSTKVSFWLSCCLASSPISSCCHATSQCFCSPPMVSLELPQAGLHSISSLLCLNWLMN